MRKALAVGRKEFHQIARDRRSLMVLLFVPAFFLLLYGYALNFDVSNIRLAVEDNDRTPASRDLVNAFVQSGYFELAASVSSSREYESLIDSGDVRVALVIPPGYQEDLLTGRRVPVQVIINGDNSNTAATVMGYVLRVLQSASAPYQMRTSAATAGGPADFRRITRLVQPPAAQRALPDPGAHRLHRHALRGDFDHAVGGSREGARHDGADSHGPDRHGRLHRRQDASVLRHLARHVGLRRAGVDGAVRSSHERLVAGAAADPVAVPGRCARDGADDFNARRIAAGGVSARRARVVSADDDVVGVRVSDREHAGRDSGHHVHRAGALFHRGAACHRAEGRRARDILDPACGAGHFRRRSR